MQTPARIPASASRSGAGSVAITSLATTTSPAPISLIRAAQALTASTTCSATIEPRSSTTAVCGPYSIARTWERS